jgi:hypothetical protein
LNLSLTALLLVILLPLMGIIALAIRLTSAGPVFDRQYFMHSDGKSFRVTKFRTTVDDIGNVKWVGAVLIRFSLDELPELWDVLRRRGEMPYGAMAARIFFREERHSKTKTAAKRDNWLKTGGFLIPKQYREPMLGDLIEDRKEMRDRGFSVLSIEAMTILQLLVACACRPKLWISALLAWLARSIG